MDKKSFRKAAIELLNKIENKEVKSQMICDDLFSLCSNYENIALYMAMENEVNLDPLILKLLNSNKHVLIPKTDKEEMRFVEITNINHPETVFNKYHIREPNSNIFVDKNKIDVFVIPGVAFDRLMNRLGRGKGFYDNYLAESDSLKIGVCFDELLFEEIPHRSHDIKMDIIVTNKRKLANPI